MPEIEWVTVGRDSGFTETTPTTSSAANPTGICTECGEPAYHHKAKKCEEHRYTKTPAPNGRRTKRQTPGGAGRSGSGPTADKWQRTLAKLLLLATSFIAVGVVSRANILDTEDELVDALSMEDSEALDIARPLGRFISGTSVSKKYGGIIVNNDDLIDAGIALSDYVTRVRQTNARIEEIVRNRENAYSQRRTGPPSYGNESYESTGQDAASGHTDDGEQYGPPRGVYAQPTFAD